MNFEPERTEQEKKQDCPVCGAFKFSHEDVCRDCDEHRRHVREMKQAAARRRRFGSIW